MKIKKKTALFGKYPACDLLNNALRMLLAENSVHKMAVSEIVRAIAAANGYLYEDVGRKLKELEIPSEEWWGLNGGGK